MIDRAVVALLKIDGGSDLACELMALSNRLWDEAFGVCGLCKGTGITAGYGGKVKCDCTKTKR